MILKPYFNHILEYPYRENIPPSTSPHHVSTKGRRSIRVRHYTHLIILSKNDIHTMSFYIRRKTRCLILIETYIIATSRLNAPHPKREKL